MVHTGKIRFWLPMFGQVKIKPEYMLQRNPELQGYYTQNQQVTLMAQTVHHEKEHLIMDNELYHYLQLSVISYNFHISIVY